MIAMKYIKMPPAGKYLATIMDSAPFLGHARVKPTPEWRGLNARSGDNSKCRIEGGRHLVEVAFRIDGGEYAGYVIPGFIDLDVASESNSKGRTLFRAICMQDYNPVVTPISWCHGRQLIVTTRNEKVGGGVIPVAVDYERVPGSGLGYCELGFPDPDQTLFPFVSDLTSELVRCLEAQGRPDVVVETAVSSCDLERALRHTTVS